MNCILSLLDPDFWSRNSGDVIRWTKHFCSTTITTSKQIGQLFSRWHSEKSNLGCCGCPACVAAKFWLSDEIPSFPRIRRRSLPPHTKRRQLPPLKHRLIWLQSKSFLAVRWYLHTSPLWLGHSVVQSFELALASRLASFFFAIGIKAHDIFTIN